MITIKPPLTIAVFLSISADS
uniref:Uncharacterized protein n=1 Tax=Nelumbo nucifera TaxID=4432 RepID=A0A822XKS1_NELNU|nr:TPA_asm: hypothetical protein HUJ06_021142 [Nelumbo nucifera]